MNDDILDILIAHGVPGTVIVRVAKLIADSQLTESRRTKNRERMKSVRARAHTLMHTETHKRASLSTVPPITKTVVVKERGTLAKSERGTRLPKNWQPDADDCTYAIAHGLEPKTLAVDFCDYWHARAGPGAVKMNWKLTWQRWCRTEKKGNSNGKSRQGRDDRRSIRAAFDRLDQILDGPDEDGEVPRQADLRLLPGGRG